MLSTRNGVGASQVFLPPGPWTNVLDFLIERFPAIAGSEWTDRMARGDVVDSEGGRVQPAQTYVPHRKLYYYRSVPGEKLNAAKETVLFEDEVLVVADKPHFLPVTPSGAYLQETLLVRLRRQLDLPALTPLHRIDRETAGIVLFAKKPALCAGYQALFTARAITKTYEAIAPVDSALEFPLTRSSRLVSSEHFMQMCEAIGDEALANKVNARTDIELMETHGAWGRYRLHPISGKRHQLRVHMAALGLPILGDRIYPRLLPHGGDDIGNPLRLLAQSVAFDDPITGEARAFSSRQKLHFPD